MEQFNNVPVSTLSISDVIEYLRVRTKNRNSNFTILLLEFFIVKVLKPELRLSELKKVSTKNKPDHYYKLLYSIELDISNNPNFIKSNDSNKEETYELRSYPLKVQPQNTVTQNNMGDNINQIESFLKYVTENDLESALLNVKIDNIKLMFLNLSHNNEKTISLNFMFHRRVIYWVNKYLNENGIRIGNLNADLRNGVTFIKLAEILFNLKIKSYNKLPKDITQELKNLSVFLKIFDSLNIPLDIKIEDVYSCRIDTICGLILLLALAFKSAPKSDQKKVLFLKPDKVSHIAKELQKAMSEGAVSNMFTTQVTGTDNDIAAKNSYDTSYASQNSAANNMPLSVSFSPAPPSVSFAPAPPPLMPSASSAPVSTSMPSASSAPAPPPMPPKLSLAPTASMPPKLSFAPTIPTIPTAPTAPTIPTAPSFAPTAPSIPTAPSFAPTAPSIPTAPSFAPTAPTIPTAPSFAPTAPTIPTAPSFAPKPPTSSSFTPTPPVPSSFTPTPPVPVVSFTLKQAPPTSSYMLTPPSISSTSGASKSSNNSDHQTSFSPTSSVVSKKTSNSSNSSHSTLGSLNEEDDTLSDLEIQF